MILVLQSSRSPEIDYRKCLPVNEKAVLITSPTALVDESCFEQVFRVPAYETSGEVVSLANRLMAEHQISRIIVRAECDILRASQLRQRWNIPGQTVESGLAFRDKVVMKKGVAAEGVAIAKYAVVNSHREIQDFASEHGYPVAVKPCDGSGAVNTKIIRSPHEVHLIPIPATGQLLVEEFVSDQLVHTDGLAINGKIVFLAASKYFNNCLSFQVGDSVGSVQLAPDSETVKDLQLLTQKVLNGLPCPQVTSFHAEFFVRANGDFVFCEIASRTGGARISDMVASAYGVNVEEICVGAQARGDVTTFCMQALQLAHPFQPSGFLLIPPRPGILAYAPTTLPFSDVHGFQSRIPNGGNLEAAIRCADSMASFLVRGKSPSDVEEKLLAADRWYRSQLRWKGEPSESACLK